MTQLKIRPLHDRIIVKRKAAETKTSSGIIIPDSAKEKPQEGSIVAVGRGRVKDDGKVVALEVKTGDKVLFGKYAGTEIQVDNEEYLMMKEEDILAIVD